MAQKRYAKYWPIVEAFSKQYNGWRAYQKSLIGQAVAEREGRESFRKFKALIGALGSINKQLLALQDKDWVAETNEVAYFIENWWIICELGLEFQKNPSACDTWANDVESIW